jgi:hypothetical protein
MAYLARYLANLVKRIYIRLTLLNGWKVGDIPRVPKNTLQELFVHQFDSLRRCRSGSGLDKTRSNFFGTYRVVITRFT